MWEDVKAFRGCDSPRGGVEYVTKVCQLIEKCDAHRRSVQVFWEV